uniref:Uncharacterized protein n=1 Tax=Timema bartmani TaxID=61472 RepID=A0A7R9F155_9NEOP|nr:unnamed protein product [Timema bartmani]
MGTRLLHREDERLCLGLLNTLKIPWRIYIVTVIILRTDSVACLTSRPLLTFNYDGPLSKRLSVLNKDTRKALIERKSTVTQRRLSQLSQRSSGLSSTTVPMASMTSMAPRYDTPLPKRKVSFINKAFQPDEQEERLERCSTLKISAGVSLNSWKKGLKPPPTIRKGGRVLVWVWEGGTEEGVPFRLRAGLADRN